MEHFLWISLSFVLLSGDSSIVQALFECQESPTDEICLLKGVKLATPEEIDQIELPEGQKYVHFLEGSIPNFGKAIYGQLEETTNLTVSHSDLESLFVGSLLVHLNASWNKLARIEKEPGSSYQKLLVLVLAHNEFSRVPNIKDFLALQHLDLSFNKIEFVSFNIFALLSQLQMLDLSNNQISSFDTDVDFQLSKLKELRLNNNKLVDLDLARWMLPNLKTLDISANELLYLNGMDLERSFPNLTRLDHSKNSWNCRAQARLHQHLQNHSISFVTDQLPCPNDNREWFGICCVESYVNFVTLQAQWDIRKLKQEMATMTETLEVTLTKVHEDQETHIAQLDQKLARQEKRMAQMKMHLLSMARMIEDLIEELYLRQKEGDHLKSEIYAKIAF